MRVLIAAGGTAGHVVPALAVADTLRADGAHVEFAGGERAEAQLVPAAGYAFHPIRAAGLSRTNPVRAARAALTSVRGLATALRLVRRLKPKDIKLFAVMSGDVNPAHLDAAFAATDLFGHIVAQGMWTGALVSAVLGRSCPALARSIWVRI